jgi:hypothetical protein
MDKKTLLLILFSALLLPTLAQAATLIGIIGKITAAVVPIGTPLVVVGFIIAGFLYISAAASPERMSLAKKALIAAVIGTILIILAATACTFIAALFGLPANSCNGGAGGGGGSGSGSTKLEGDAYSAAKWEALQGEGPAQDEKTLADDANSYNNLSRDQKNQIERSLQPTLNQFTFDGLSAAQQDQIFKDNPGIKIDNPSRFTTRGGSSISNPNYNNTLDNNVNSTVNSIRNTFGIPGNN